MSGKRDSDNPYTLALEGLRFMTLGGKEAKLHTEKSPECRASEPALLGQLPRASEFSPPEVVSLSGDLAREEREPNSALAVDRGQGRGD
eukprot:3256312-Rhodomonas_salina.1